jgi:5-methylcytosine-specific restriction endonuclease McrA
VSKLLKSEDSSENNGCWRVPLSADEQNEIEKVIKDGKLQSSTNKRMIIIAFMHGDINKKVVVYRTNTYIKCDFNAGQLFSKAFSKNKWDIFHPNDFKIMAKVNETWIQQGKNYKESAKAFWIPSNLSLSRKISYGAEMHGLSDEQYLELLGYTVIDKNQKTKDRLEKYLIPGTKNIVRIPTNDNFYQTLATAGRRKGYPGIKEYVETLGYILDNQNYSTKGINSRSSAVISQEVSDRVKKKLAKYIIPGTNQILLEDSNSSDYKYFQQVARANQYSGLKEMIENLGYIYESRRGKKGYDDGVFKKIIDLRYIVEANYIYISSYDPFYEKLYNYASRRSFKMDDYLKKIGYVRIKRMPDVPETYMPYDYTDDLLPHPDSSWDGDPQNDIERHAIDKELEILKNLESEYKDVSSKEHKIKRNQRLVRVLKKMYGCKCQLCKDSLIPPIVDKNGEIYCEVHHINPLSNASGADDINEIDTYKNTIVLCPFHHAYLHHQNGGNFYLVRDKRLFGRTCG